MALQWLSITPSRESYWTDVKLRDWIMFCRRASRSMLQKNNNGVYLSCERFRIHLSSSEFIQMDLENLVSVPWKEKGGKHCRIMFSPFLILTLSVIPAQGLCLQSVSQVGVLAGGRRLKSTLCCVNRRSFRLNYISGSAFQQNQRQGP